MSNYGETLRSVQNKVVSGTITVTNKLSVLLSTNSVGQTMIWDCTGFPMLARRYTMSLTVPYDYDYQSVKNTYVVPNYGSGTG